MAIIDRGLGEGARDPVEQDREDDDDEAGEKALAALRRGSWVIVDEVQRLPGLLNEVHRFIEERRLKFALLGSSARKLKQAGTNLLAGRAAWKRMYPFAPHELGKQFDLERTLRFGSIPLVWVSKYPAETLRSYVELYLREEIKAEALVRNLPGFARFLPVAALFHGQVINVAGLSRDAGVARTTVHGYLEILEDTLVAQRLPAYEAKLRVRERRHPKLYWADAGLVRAIKKQLGPPAHEERGALFEGWVFSLLNAYREVDELFDEIFYWAPSQAGTLEVDFILRRAKQCLAIEVKSGVRVGRQDLKGLEAIADLPGLVKRILVYTGTRRRRTPEGVDIWPLERFLETLAAGTLWE